MTYQWDPPCQEHIFPMTNSMLRGAHGVMIVCDLTNMNSFIKMRKWCDEVREKAVHNIAILLVGNKSDLSSQRVVFAEKGKVYFTCLIYCCHRILYF